MVTLGGSSWIQGAEFGILLGPHCDLMQEECPTQFSSLPRNVKPSKKVSCAHWPSDSIWTKSTSSSFTKMLITSYVYSTILGKLDTINLRSFKAELSSVPAASLRDDKATRITAHTDFDTFTLLFQDDVGGLEAEDPNHPGTYKVR